MREPQKHLRLLLLLCAGFFLAACSILPQQDRAASTSDTAPKVAAGMQATEEARTLTAVSVPTTPPQIPTAIPTAPLPRPSAALQIPTALPTETFANAADEPNSTPTIASAANSQATSTPAGPTPTASLPPTPPVPPAEVNTIIRPDPAANKQVNVQLVLDASASMEDDIGGETKIEAARRALEQVIDGLDANNPALNVGLHVFGHESDNTSAGRALSCQSTEQLVPLAGIDKDLLRQQISAWSPTGWSPISLALQEAGAELPASGPNVRNVIILIADGADTCNGDPCAMAEALAASDTRANIDVIGLDLNPGAASELHCISRNSDGTYNFAQDSNALVQKVEQMIEEATERTLLNVQVLGADGNLNGDAIVEVYDEAGERVMLLNETKPSGQPGLIDGYERAEVAPGTYTLEVRATTQLLYGGGTTEYTVEIVEGQETVAVVGFGSIIVTNPGGGLEMDGGDAFRGIDIQRKVDGTWEDTHFANYIVPANEIISFAPGEYRIIYTDYRLETPAVVADGISIKPGKRVTVEIDFGLADASQPRPTADAANGDVIRSELSRTILSIEVIDANGNRTGDAIVSLIDEAEGGYVPMLDRVEGSGEPGLYDGYERLQVAPGSYIIEVDGTGPNGHYHSTTKYPAEVRSGTDTTIVVGFGGIVLSNPGGGLNSRGGEFRDIEVQRKVEHPWEWESTLFETYVPAEELISLAPGEYRVVYIGEDEATPEVLADNIIIEPGQRLDVELAHSGSE